MYCPNCGNLLNDDDAFCGACGSRVDRVRPEPGDISDISAVGREPAAAPAAEPPKEKKSNKKAVILLICLAAVIAAAVLMVFGPFRSLFHAASPENEQETTVEYTAGGVLCDEENITASFAWLELEQNPLDPSRLNAELTLDITNRNDFDIVVKLDDPRIAFGGDSYQLYTDAVYLSAGEVGTIRCYSGNYSASADDIESISFTIRGTDEAVRSENGSITYSFNSSSTMIDRRFTVLVNSSGVSVPPAGKGTGPADLSGYLGASMEQVEHDFPQLGEFVSGTAEDGKPVYTIRQNGVSFTASYFGTDDLSAEPEIDTVTIFDETDCTVLGIAYGMPFEDAARILDQQGFSYTVQDGRFITDAFRGDQRAVVESENGYVIRVGIQISGQSYPFQ